MFCKANCLARSTENVRRTQDLEQNTSGLELRNIVLIQTNPKFRSNLEELILEA